jgi:hypothetical protein
MSILEPPTFKYDPLDQKEPQFRLLTIYPAPKRDDPLHCRLSSEYFYDVDRPSYEALSYTWGTLTNKRKLIVNDNTFTVTENLDCALRYLRRTDQERCIWADAICIDQSNIPEKNYMVYWMHCFYQDASRTVLWLGEKSIDSDEALDVIETIGQDSSLAFAASILNTQETKRRLLANEAISPAHVAQWNAVANLFFRPWWTRAWVLQEMNHAQRCIVQCGDRTLDRDVIAHFITRLNACIGATLGYGIIPKASILRFTQIQKITPLFKGSYPSLGAVLGRTRPCQSTDPRDKVYACLNNVQPRPTNLKADYSKSVVEVYIDATKAVILQDNNLRILAFCERISADTPLLDGRERQLIQNLPSWVPDFANERLSAPLFGGYEHWKRETTQKEFIPFRVSGNLASTISIGHLDGLELLFLVVSGVILDRVDNITSHNYTGNLAECMSEGLRIIEEKDGILNPDGESITEVLLRTMAIDRTAEGELLSPEAANSIITPDNPMFRSCGRALPGRMLFTTSAGFLGLGPQAVEKDDVIAVIFGCHVPMVLRPHQIDETRTCFEVIGEACRHLEPQS